MKKLIFRLLNSQIDLLPNYKNAYITIEKLRNYSLCEIHAEGGSKAKVFKSSLGIEAEDAITLKVLILEALKYNPIIKSIINDYRIIYSIPMSISVKEKTAIVTTAWIVRIHEDCPRLVSAYIKDK